MKLIRQMDFHEIYRCLFWEITENLTAKLSSVLNHAEHSPWLLQQIQGLNTDWYYKGVNKRSNLHRILSSPA
jgi:hypothetical protein